MIKVKFIALALLLFFGNAIAGDFDDVQSAIQRKDFEVATKLLQPIAEQGDRRAQAFLAFVILGRNDVPKNYQSVAIWAKKSADQGESLGQVLLGMLYLNGQGVEQDDELAVSLIRQAAAWNNPLGLYELGKLMLVGRGVARDLNEGESLLKKAVVGFPDFKINADLIVRKAADLDQWRKGLGHLSCESFFCASRFGATRGNLKVAYGDMLWVELAAMTLDEGFRSDLSYFYLGRASEGLGDLNEALIYYNLAMNPHQFGQPCDSPIINNCDGIVLPRDALNRRNLVTIAIQDKEKRDAEYLGLSKESRKVAEAAEKTRLALEQEAGKLKVLVQNFVEDRERAEHGATDAQFRLANMYFSGTGTPTDEKAGLIWLTKAAQQGHSDAQYYLGERYRTGLSIGRDSVKAEMWFRKAMQQGHADTVGGFAALIADKQKRAMESADAATKRAAAIAAAARRQEEDRAELSRKAKLESAAKLKSL